MVFQDFWRCWKQFRVPVLSVCTLMFLIIIYTPPYQLRPVKEVYGWGVSVTRDTKVYIVPGNETSVINGRGLCFPSTKLVIVVTSAPSHLPQRLAIRQTWASHNFTDIKIAFLLGIPDNSTQQIQIDDENDVHHDIIQEGFLDSYNNLTIKSVMMLKWYLHYCSFPKFLMKTDDDMFVNISVVSTLINTVNHTNLLIGSLICKARPILDSKNKWYSPRYMYGRSVYPNYLSGTGYLMSRDVAKKLYVAALTTPLFHLEDVFLTGICARKVHVKPHNHRSFTYDKLEIGCHPDMATIHGFSPVQLISSWATRYNCSHPPGTNQSTLGV